MSEQGPLKCRFCDYQVNRWRGKKSSGVAKIYAHVNLKHPTEQKAILIGIGRETYDLQDDEACEDLAELED